MAVGAAQIVIAASVVASAFPASVLATGAPVVLERSLDAKLLPKAQHAAPRQFLENGADTANGVAASKPKVPRAVFTEPSIMIPLITISVIAVVLSCGVIAWSVIRASSDDSEQ